jgi:hypothetical protein
LTGHRSFILDRPELLEVRPCPRRSVRDLGLRPGAVEDGELLFGEACFFRDFLVDFLDGAGPVEVVQRLQREPGEGLAGRKGGRNHIGKLTTWAIAAAIRREAHRETLCSVSG